MSNSKLRSENSELTEGLSLFNKSIYEYYHKSTELHKLNDYDQNQDLLIEVLDIEFEILKKFGLPDTENFRGILDLFSWNETISEQEVGELHEQLKAIAIEFLSSPAKSDIEILFEGKLNNLVAGDILPQTAFDANSYNVFLYESMFYSDHYAIELILEEMMKGNQIPLFTLKRIDTALLLKGKLDKEVKHIGLKYWPDFVKSKKIEQRSGSSANVNFVDDIRTTKFEPLPEYLSVTYCYVAGLKFIRSSKPYVCAAISSVFVCEWININVYISLNDCISLLKKSNNKTLSSLLRSMLLDFKQNAEGCDKIISVRDCYGKYLFCEGLDWEVELTDLEDEDGLDIEGHNYYELDGFVDYIIGD